MPRAPKSSPSTSGVILPYAEAERLQSDPAQQANVKPLWGFGERAWYPFQRRVLTALEDEIGMFGGVGGGKTQAMMAWLISGNPHLPSHNEDGTPNLVNISYMYSPNYYALLLRENEKDLWQFIAKAREMYEPLGIVYTQGMFRHPMGGTIVCGHMADQTAWQKYLGNEYVRIAIDEAPLIPDLGLYEELRARNRSVYNDLRTQILLAGNYGGKGSAWVYDRFMNVRRPDGSLYERGDTIEERVHDPDTGEYIMTRTRVWIFSSYKDNPKFRDTPRYRAILASLTDPRKRAAYMKGEWNVFTGAYFGEVWRTEHHEDVGEPAHAFHVIKRPAQPKLEPWFTRAIGFDWGFKHDAAITWLAQHGVTNQIHTYRELAVSGASSERLGFELARLSLDELNAHPDHAITVYLSHDAFRRDDATHTTAELIMRGASRILGPTAVHAPEIIIRNLEESYSRGAIPTPAEEKARAEAFEGLRRQRKAGLTFRIATKISALGWQYIRDLMRWEEILTTQAKYSPELAMQLLLESQEQYRQYVQAFENHGPPEVLPKLVVWDSCPKLIAAIPRLQYKDDVDDADSKHFAGKDSVDSWHYGLIGLREVIPQEPWEAFRAKKLNTAVATAPDLSTNDLVWINRDLEQQWAERNEGPISFAIPRGGRRTRAMQDAAQPGNALDKSNWRM